MRTRGSPSTPVWIDNRTGVGQIWTAPVSVSGVAIKHGDAGLADLDDVSKRVSLTYTRTRYDRRTNVLSAMAHLKNTGTDTLRGPLKVRVLSLDSELGVAQLFAADGTPRGPGSILDFTSLIPSGGLPKDSITAGLPVTIRLTHLKSVWQDGIVKTQLAQVNVKVLGRARKAAAPVGGGSR
jgi:hypothetical protein